MSEEISDELYEFLQHPDCLLHASDLGEPIPFDCCIGGGDKTLDAEWLERLESKLQEQRDE